MDINPQHATMVLMAVKSRKAEDHEWNPFNLRSKLDSLLDPCSPFQQIDEFKQLIFYLVMQGSLDVKNGALFITPKGEQKILEDPFYRFFKNYLDGKDFTQL